MVLDNKQRTVVIDNIEIDFAAEEFDLLKLLLSNPKQVFTRDRLLDMIWDMEYFGGTRTVDTHIQRIRKSWAISIRILLLRFTVLATKE